MAVFELTSPQGEVFEITAPDDATEDQVLAYAQQQFQQQKADEPSYAQQQEEQFQQRIRGGTAGEGVLGFAEGMGKSIYDTGRGLKQIGLQVADYVAPHQANVADTIAGRDPSRAAAYQAEIDEARRLDAPLMETGRGVAGNITGHVLQAVAPGGALTAAGKAKGATNLVRAGAALSAPKTILGSAAQGAALAGIQPVATGESRAQNAAVGAAFGAGGKLAANVLGRAISPAGEGAKLAKSGVHLTPGMMAGRAGKSLEDAARSVPFLGDAIADSQRASFESFNRATFNKVLEPLGKRLPKGFSGREAFAHVNETVGKAYDDLLPQLRVQMDGDFVQQTQGMRQIARGLPDKQREMFEHILQKEVLSKFTPHGLMSGETMKQVESKLGALIGPTLKSDDPYVRQLGNGVREMQAMLRHLVMRGNPQHAQQLQKINASYAMLSRVQNAVARVTSEDGVFTPEALLSAVKSGDKSMGKRAFARGDALLQEFAERARKVMGNKVADSGTARRIMTGAPLLVGAYAEPTTLAVAGAASLPYLPILRRGANALMTARPPGAEMVGNALSRYGALPAVAYGAN